MGLDPADALDAIDYVRWKLDCLAAVAAGQPWPPIPSRYREASTGDDGGYELVPDAATQQVIDALMALEASSTATATSLDADPLEGDPHEQG